MIKNKVKTHFKVQLYAYFFLSFLEQLKYQQNPQNDFNSDAAFPDVQAACSISGNAPHVP